MAREIAEIRRDITETRERLRDTAEAIGWKADVPARARDVLRETAAVVRERVASGHSSDESPAAGGNGGPSLVRRIGDIASSVTGSVATATHAAADTAGSLGHDVREHMPTVGGARQEVERAAGTVRANPIAIAAGALALGAVAGMLLPSTRTEDEHLGPMTDEVRGRGAEVAQEAVDKGREAISEAGERLSSVARETGTGPRGT